MVSSSMGELFVGATALRHRIKYVYVVVVENFFSFFIFFNSDLFTISKCKKKKAQSKAKRIAK